MQQVGCLDSIFNGFLYVLYIKTEKGGSHERPFRLNKY